MVEIAKPSVFFVYKPASVLTTRFMTKLFNFNRENLLGLAIYFNIFKAKLDFGLFSVTGKIINQV